MGWFGWALLSALFAALTGLFMKLGVSNTHADVATCVRSLVMALLLVGVISISGKWPQVARLGISTTSWLVLAGVAGCASWICYGRALQAGPLGMVATVDKTAFVFAVLLGVVLLRERPSFYEWVAFVLILIGVLVLQLAQRTGQT